MSHMHLMCSWEQHFDGTQRNYRHTSQVLTQYCRPCQHWRQAQLLAALLWQECTASPVWTILLCSKFCCSEPAWMHWCSRYCLWRLVHTLHQARKVLLPARSNGVCDNHIGYNLCWARSHKVLELHYASDGDRERQKRYIQYNMMHAAGDCGGWCIKLYVCLKRIIMSWSCYLEY